MSGELQALKLMVGLEQSRVNSKLQAPRDLHRSLQQVQVHVPAALAHTTAPHKQQVAPTEVLRTEHPRTVLGCAFLETVRLLA